MLLSRFFNVLIATLQTFDEFSFCVDKSPVAMPSNTSPKAPEPERFREINLFF